MEPSEPMRRNELRTLASSLLSPNPDVQRFIQDALDEIEWLRSRLAAADQSVAVLDAKASISPGLSGRHQDLMLEQLTEITDLRDSLDRVRALCDLAEWAAESTGGTRPSVEVSDLRKAMRKR